MAHQNNSGDKGEYCFIASVSESSKDYVISALSKSAISHDWSSGRAVGFRCPRAELEHARDVLRADAVEHGYHITFASVVLTALIPNSREMSARKAIESAGIIFNTHHEGGYCGLLVEPGVTERARTILSGDALVHNYVVKFDGLDRSSSADVETN